MSQNPANTEEILWDFNHKALRPGQRQALEVLFERCKERLPFTAVVLPTRYGKTDLQRIGAVQMVRAGLISVAFALSPAVNLRDQCDDQDEWDKCQLRYDLPPRLCHLHRRIKQEETTYNANGEIMLATTIQFVAGHVDDFCRFARSQLATTGKPVLFFVDESHTASVVNMWGNAGRQVTQAGALACPLTGTAIRDDGVPLLGFNTEEINLGETLRTTYHASENPEMVRRIVEFGCWQRTKLKAHHETTFRQAWEEVRSPLCKVSRTPVDVFIRDLNLPKEEVAAEDAPKLLSELGPTETRKILGRVVRDEKVMRHAIQIFLSQLADYRKLNPDVAGIIFCGADREDGEENGLAAKMANVHAREIEKIIKSEPEGDGLVVVIATSARTDAEDDTGVKKIKRFKDGSGDILIVKQMGGVGFDCPRLKVLLDLSPTRSYASWVQRVMRIATPFGKIRICRLITPHDVLSQLLWFVAIEKEGGDVLLKRRFEMQDLVSDEEVPRTDGPDGPEDEYDITGTKLADFDDNEQHIGDAVLAGRVQNFRQNFPEAAAYYTDAEIAARMGEFFKDDPPVKEPTLQQQIETKKNAINTTVAKIARIDIGRAYDKSLMGPAIRNVWHEIGDETGVYMIKNVSDLAILEKVHDAAKRLLIRREASQGAQGASFAG